MCRLTATWTHLWPEHFDAAIDIDDVAAGLRGGHGFSPGDHNSPEPLASGDPRAAALAFFHDARRRVLSY